MAMTVNRLSDGSETWNASTGACTSAEIKYLVVNAIRKSSAIEAVLAAAPNTYGGLTLKEVRFDNSENAGMEISAVYAESDSGSGGGEQGNGEEATESFDCGGGTKHMTHAITQRRVYGGSTDDAGGGIGWNGEVGDKAEFAGVDVPCADMRETYTKTIDVAVATSTSYKKTVARLVGRVNSTDFKGWSAGEVMFLGCSFSCPVKSQKTVNVSYNFRIMPNETSCVVAGLSCGAKKGFEYIWARSKVASVNGAPEVQVKGVYKCVVCQSGNFSALGL